MGACATQKEVSMEPGKQKDRIRGEFTVWLEKLIVRAKLSFIRQHSKYLNIISIEDLSEEAFAILDEPIVSRDTFEFEDEKIERAFIKLPISRRRILIMLFLEELSPEEVAKRIGCSVNSVYLQRMRAIRELRKLITMEDENEHK